MKNLLILCLTFFILLFTVNVYSIDSSECYYYIGKPIQVGIILESDNNIIHTDIIGKLLNVFNGMDVFDNFFAGYYLVVEIKTIEGTKKSIVLPCEKITYIKEIK